MASLTIKAIIVVLLGLTMTAALPLEERDIGVYAGSTMDMDDATTEEMDMGMDHSMSMQMYFYASAHATILFEGWHTMTAGELFGSCLAVMVMAFLYEGFKVSRQSLLTKATKKATANQVSTYNSNGDPNGVGSKDMIVQEQQSAPELSMAQSLMSSSHIIQSLLHVLQLFFSYCLMLIFMTYNIYLCLFLVLGGGLGYWFFAWKTALIADKNEHCN